MECPGYLHGIMQETVNMENMAAIERLTPSGVRSWGPTYRLASVGLAILLKKAMLAFDKAWDTPAKSALPVVPHELQTNPVVPHKSPEVSHKDKDGG